MGSQTLVSEARSRLTPVWWVAAIGLGLTALAIIIYSAEGIRWISDVNNFLLSPTFASALAAGAARRAADSALIFYYVATAISGICFIIWFRAAYRNLELAGIQLRFSRGWSIGSWFVPFLNFVRPKHMANDFWRVSRFRAVRPGASVTPVDIAGQPVSPLVHWWWGLYLAGGPVFGIGVFLAESHGSAGDSLDQILRLERTGFYIGLVGALVYLAAAALAAIYAWQVSQAHDLQLGRNPPG
jgi:hypothetical protein